MLKPKAGGYSVSWRRQERFSKGRPIQCVCGSRDIQHNQRESYCRNCGRSVWDWMNKTVTENVVGVVK